MSSTHLPDDFEALKIFQAEYDQGKLDVVVASSGGSVTPLPTVSGSGNQAR